LVTAVRGRDRIICGLDVGTWKICLVMVRAHRKGRIDLIASGFSNSQGLVKGVVANMEDVTASIRRVVEEVETKSSHSVNSVVAGISGSHIRSNTYRGAVQVQGKNSEVMINDMGNAVRAAESAMLSPEREILHLLPQEFFLNNRGGITNPLGLIGSQLDVSLHVVTCDSALHQSLVNAINKARVEVKRVVLQSIASGAAVLSREEKDLGTAVIDIGGGTTDIAVFAKNSACFASVIPVGGEHFTRDLVERLRISREEAERIKIESGNVLPEVVPPDEVVTVRGLGVRGERDFPRRNISEDLHDRAAELLEIVKSEIIRSGVNLIGGAVLTGGGSLIGGILELSERILDMPVRLGLPRGAEGWPQDMQHPTYACAVGLTILEAERSILQDFQQKLPPPSLSSRILRYFER
jgi:cell division protein FtsA